MPWHYRLIRPFGIECAQLYVTSATAAQIYILYFEMRSLFENNKTMNRHTHQKKVDRPGERESKSERPKEKKMCGAFVSNEQWKQLEKEIDMLVERMMCSRNRQHQQPIFFLVQLQFYPSLSHFYPLIYFARCLRDRCFFPFLSAHFGFGFCCYICFGYGT